MMNWIAHISGWVVGVAISLLVATPWAVERLHRLIPIYEVSPASVTVICTPMAIVFSVKARKVAEFDVLDNGDLGRLRISWVFEGIEQTNTIPLIDADGDFVPTRPEHVAGDEFVVGPFMIPRHKENTLLSVSVVLPGYRWGFHQTTAVIGPIYLPPCPPGLMRRGELRNLITPLVPPRVRFARKKLDNPDPGADVLVNALPEFGRLP